MHTMCRRLFARLEDLAPFAAMNGGIKAEFIKHGIVGEVDEIGVGQFEPDDQRWMLHEPLIVFGPRRGEFPRGIDGRRPDGIPPSAKLSRTLSRQRQMGPTRYKGPPKFNHARQA